MLGGLGVLVATTAGGPGAQAQPTPGCTPAASVQAIIDDSASMAGSDRSVLRLAGLKLLLQNPDNANRLFGAVEFGSTAKLLFAPGRISQFRQQMISVLTGATKADDGATNYNDGFTAGVSNNPSANARIFLTDGAHNIGTYGEGHRLPNATGRVPPTYVVGLGIGPATGAPSPGVERQERRLQRIANETKGRYFPSVTSDTLQRTFNQINSLLNCVAAPVDLGYPVFLRQGQTRSATTNVTSSSRNVDVVLTWGNTLNQFTVSRITFLGRKNERLAITSAKKKKLKRIKRTRKFSSGTFTGFRVKRPKGTRRIRVTVRAKRLNRVTAEAPSAQVTLRR